MLAETARVMPTRPDPTRPDLTRGRGLYGARKINAVLARAGGVDARPVSRQLVERLVLSTLLVLRLPEVQTVCLQLTKARDVVVGSTALWSRLVSVVSGLLRHGGASGTTRRRRSRPER